MIRKNDLLALQNSIRQYNLEEKVVLNDESSLLFHGCKDSMMAVGFDVSSTIFETIYRELRHPLFKQGGQREMKVNDLVIVREGMHVNRQCVDGVWVYPFEDIKTRLKLKGDLRHLELPEVKAREERVKVEEVVKTFENLTDDQATFELRCKAADWYYSYSDDLSVYRRGRDQCEALKKEAEVHGGIHLDIYKYYSSK